MQGDKKPVVMTEDIDQSVAKKLHASQHASGGSDPITPAAIGALGYLGSNPISSVDDDTTANWVALGSGYAFFSTYGLLNNQPQTYGFVTSIVRGNNVYQTWVSMPQGKVYRRSSNGQDSLPGGWNNVWTEFATTDYALPRDGSGDATSISLRQVANQGRGLIFKSHNDSGDWGTAIEDYDANGNCAVIIAKANMQKITTILSGVEYEILHTGNKPSGEYFGNGSNVAWTVSTGGIGNVCVIHRQTAITLVTPAGGVCFDVGDKTTTYFAASELKFENGVLTIATSSPLVNMQSTNGYKYHVL